MPEIPCCERKMPHLTLIYPAWPKLPEQTEFHLPPHGPVCLAATIPEEYNICFIDENVDTLDLEAGTDLVLLSMMLTCQLPRGFEIAARIGYEVVQPRSPCNSDQTIDFSKMVIS